MENRRPGRRDVDRLLRPWTLTSIPGIVFLGLLGDDAAIQADAGEALPAEHGLSERDIKYGAVAHRVEQETAADRLHFDRVLDSGLGKAFLHAASHAN